MYEYSLIMHNKDVQTRFWTLCAQNSCQFVPRQLLSDPLALPMLEDFNLYWWSIRNLIYSALIYFEVVLFYFSPRKGSYNFLKRSILFWMVYLTHSVLMDGLVLILLNTSGHNIIISYICCCPLVFLFLAKSSFSE